jgi:hypothetical protein
MPFRVSAVSSEAPLSTARIVGDQAVGPILVHDALDALAGLVDLDLDRVLELVAPIAFPLGAGDGDEPTIFQGLGALVLFGGGDGVELAQDAVVANARRAPSVA